MVHSLRSRIDSTVLANNCCSHSVLVDFEVGGVGDVLLDGDGHRAIGVNIAVDVVGPVHEVIAGGRCGGEGDAGVLVIVAATGHSTLSLVGADSADDELSGERLGGRPVARLVVAYTLHLYLILGTGREVGETAACGILPLACRLHLIDVNIIYIEPKFIHCGIVDGKILGSNWQCLGICFPGTCAIDLIAPGKSRDIVRCGGITHAEDIVCTTC